MYVCVCVCGDRNLAQLEQIIGASMFARTCVGPWHVSSLTYVSFGYIIYIHTYIHTHTHIIRDGDLASMFPDICKALDALEIKLSMTDPSKIEAVGKQVCVCVYVYVCMYMCVCVMCVYVYIYTHCL